LVLRSVSLSVDPSPVVDYSPNEVVYGLEIVADIDYILVRQNQVGIDSFILHNNLNHLYLPFPIFMVPVTLAFLPITERASTVTVLALHFCQAASLLHFNMSCTRLC
jgi:hypothetical protein